MKPQGPTSIGLNDFLREQPSWITALAGLVGSAMVAIITIQCVNLALGQQGGFPDPKDVSIDMAILLAFNLAGLVTKRIILVGVIGSIVLGGYVSYYVFFAFSKFDLGSVRALQQNIFSPLLNALFMSWFVNYTRPAP